MTWSYSGDPGSSDRDHLRFLIGDTNTNDQQLTNEELDFLLTEHGSVPSAAIAACHVLIAQYSRLCDQRTGDISISYSQRVKGYQNLIITIREGQTNPAPYAGGISKSDIDAVNEDEDRQPPEFGLGAMDYPTDEPTGYGGTGGVL